MIMLEFVNDRSATVYFNYVNILKFCIDKIDIMRYYETVRIEWW